MQEGTFLSSGHLGETAVRRGDAFKRDCPARRLLDRLADKWSVLIMLMLNEGDIRFNSLKRRVNGISQKMLSQTLRSLERDGLVVRHVDTSPTISVTYSISVLGRSLVGTLQEMLDWAETRMTDVEQAQLSYDRRLGEARDAGFE